MAEADDDIVTLSVPIGVAALYLVATSAPPADLRAAVDAIAAELPEPLGRSVPLMIKEEWLTVEVDTNDGAELPAGLLEVFGATRDQTAEAAAASHLIQIRAFGKAWWQPYQEWAARAVAVELADQLGAPAVIDLFTPRLLTTQTARESLPDPAGETALMDWVVVPQSSGERGYWFTTRGLRRFGLPELQTMDVPGALTEAWTSALSGIAMRLLDEWQAALLQDDKPSFVEIPAELAIRESDVARAFQVPAHGGGTARIRLRIDPSSDPEIDTFLTVVPPRDYPLSAGEHIAEVCAALFGEPEAVIRELPRDAAMDEAIATARSELPRVRDRFLAGEFDLDVKLIAKHGLTQPDGGREFVWATISGWPEPGLLVGTSMNDALSDTAVRVGRPVRIDSATVVDWALWKVGAGVVEGGWTNRLLDSGDEDGSD